MDEAAAILSRVTVKGLRFKAKQTGSFGALKKRQTHTWD